MNFKDFRAGIILTLGYHVARAHISPEQAVSLLNGFGMRGDAMREDFVSRVGYLQDASPPHPEIEALQAVIRRLYKMPKVKL